MPWAARPPPHRALFRVVQPKVALACAFESRADARRVVLLTAEEATLPIGRFDKADRHRVDAWVHRSPSSRGRLLPPTAAGRHLCWFTVHPTERILLVPGEQAHRAGDRLNLAWLTLAKQAPAHGPFEVRRLEDLSKLALRQLSSIHSVHAIGRVADGDARGIGLRTYNI